MRNFITLSLTLLCSMLFATVDCAWAVPITGGTGPGGVGLTTVVDPLVLWLESDEITGLLDGAPIVSWGNTVTHANAAGAATVANTAPTFESGGGDLKNGNPVLNFSGPLDATTGDVLSGTGAVSFTAEKTLFVVAQQLVNNGCCNGALHAGGDNNGLGANSALWHTDWGGAGTPAGSPAKLGSYGVISGQYINTGTPATNLYVDGTGPLDNSAGIARGVAGSTYLIGSRATNGNGLSRFFEGNISEAIVYNSLINSTELVLVNNYLSAKWDIALTADNRYTGDTLHDYDLDVFGIGNDGSSVFTNGGSNGMGIDAAGLSTGEWIMAGHAQDTNGIGPIETGVNIGSGDRWDRVWFVDNNGTSAAATLGFNFDDAGLTGLFDGLDTFRLLYTDSSSLTDWEFLGDIGAVQSGDIITFDLSAIDLQSGFYTLGINAEAPVPEPSSLLLLGLGVLGMLRHTRRRHCSRRA